MGDVLSIAKLRVGQEAYTLAGVAQSLDDYYTGVGETSGVWIGTSAGRLGLVGDVTADDLRAVMAGIAPGTGGLSPNGETIRPHPRRVPGFDLTWKAPKSVSALYAVSDDPRVQAAIIEAGTAAVREALGWLEREAIRVRRGSGNEAFLNGLAARDPAAADDARIRSLRARGVVAASFRHRTSRAGDPLLHWHVLVPNLVEGPDGRWSAMVHPDLYRAVRAAGEVFQTVVRAELTARLGIEWRPGRHVPEAAGVPAGLCEVFSKRSAEVDAWLAATGTPDDPAGRQAAVLATRRAKPEVEHERFDAWWKAQAVEFGWGPDAAEALVSSMAPRAVAVYDELWTRPTSSAAGGVTEELVEPEDWIGGLCRELTASDATFTRAQVVQAVAARLGDGASIATLERVVARVFASPHLVPIADTATLRWTSREHLDLEQRLVSAAHDSRGQRTAIGPADVERALSMFLTIGDDQAAAVKVLAGSIDGVSVLVGPAGTGKTFTLAAVRHAFEQTGHRVSGAAPSGRAAHELEQDSAIAASTMHRLLGSWEHGYDLPDSTSVVVVDEAGMAATRELEAIVSRVVGVGGRVILVGDHRQLPEVTAGGGFGALATDPASTVAQLRVNRRQRQIWEQAALRHLRDGAVPGAVAAYRDHDRVIVVDERADLISAAVARWSDAERSGVHAVLLAGTNETVDALNTAVRTMLVEHGALTQTVDAHGRWAVGDRVMIRSNRYDLTDAAGRPTRVLNGQAATVLAGTDVGDTGEAGLLVRMDRDGTDVSLPAEFVTRSVSYAYAATTHRAQGGTWDLSITVGLDGLYREAAYVAMSRGRETNWLIVTDPELAAVDAELARHDATIPLPVEEPDDVDTELISRLSTSRAKTLALTSDPHAGDVDTLARTRSFTDIEARADYCRDIEQTASRIVGIDPDRTKWQLQRLHVTATHIAIGQRIKAADRNNIGTVINVDDSTGTVDVQFVATDGRSAVRTMPWDRVAIIDPKQPDAREMTPTALATLDRVSAPLREQLDRWQSILADHGVEPDDRRTHERARQLTIARATAALTAAEPDWLTGLVGPRPTAPAAAQVWDDAVINLTTHRLRHGVDEPAVATTADYATAELWAAVSPELARARVWLDTHTTQPAVVVTRTRSRRELRDRLVDLDAILATAPPDVRPLLARLEHGDALPEFDTAALIDEALAARGERRKWVLEHWPHVIERMEIVDALSVAVSGPDPDLLLARLAASTDDDLATAAGDAEAWLLTLAAQIVDDVDDLDASTEQLLADVAGYRRHWDISDPEPLGVAATDIDQAMERHLFVVAIDQRLIDRPTAQMVDHGDELVEVRGLAVAAPSVDR